MNVGQSIVFISLAAALCACGGGDGVDKTGRTNEVVEHGLVSSPVGTGSGGFADGKFPKLLHPSAMAIGADGAIYIADTANHRIRKSLNGIVSTLAGTGATTPFADGPGDTASFSSPVGIALDAKGNVYVADTGNNRVRKISPTGEVTTLAGAGEAGSRDDAVTPTLATFDGPSGIAVDSSGSNIYVADYNTHLIRKVTEDGVVTVAGSAGKEGRTNGVGAAARFQQPVGLALSPSGFLYVADCGSFFGSNNLIRKIDLASFEVSTLAGIAGVLGKEDGPAAQATFSGPSGVAVFVDRGVETVYVADSNNNLIRKIDSKGEVSTFAGSGQRGDTDAIGVEASFNAPRGVAVDSKGDIYVADTSNHLIRKIKK